MLPQITLSLLSLLSISISLTGVNAQNDLKVTEPSADHWWIAQSVNTLAWTGTTPSQFSVFIVNNDTNLLTSKLALISIEPLYEYSKDVNPGNITPGPGYQIQLTDDMNSNNVYAQSEPFEIKAVGSPYPPQSSGSATPSGSTSGSSSASSSGSSTPSSSNTSPASSNGDRSLKYMSKEHAMVLTATGALPFLVDMLKGMV